MPRSLGVSGTRLPNKVGETGFLIRIIQVSENAWSMVETDSKCGPPAAQNIVKVDPAVASESLESPDCINAQFRSIEAVNGKQVLFEGLVHVEVDNFLTTKIAIGMPSQATILCKVTTKYEMEPKT
jgi:hypothetical protein